jgi:protein tyrosine phosphatase (PTP) superfamily phosphohydrolase (DUF442 family)
MLMGKAILLLFLALIAAGIWTWRQYFDAYHLATVQQGVLYRDGVRSARQFATAIRRVHPRTIVSFVDDREIAQEPFVGEVVYCRENRIDLVRIPVRLGGWPTGDQVREFLAIATDSSRQPVLIHCAQGVRRTGMMVAAYQESVLKFDRPRAKAAMLTFGHSRRTISDVQRFIDLYDPDRQSLTEELPVSKE